MSSNEKEVFEKKSTSSQKKDIKMTKLNKNRIEKAIGQTNRQIDKETNRQTD